MSKSPKFGKLSKPQAIRAPTAEQLNPNKKSFENLSAGKVNDQFHRLGAMAKASPRQMVAKRTFGQKVLLNFAILGAVFATVNTTVLYFSKPLYTRMRLTQDDQALTIVTPKPCLPLYQNYHTCLDDQSGPVARQPDQCLDQLMKYSRCKAQHTTVHDLKLISVKHSDKDYKIE